MTNLSLRLERVSNGYLITVNPLDYGEDTMFVFLTVEETLDYIRNKMSDV